MKVSKAESIKALGSFVSWRLGRNRMKAKRPLDALMFVPQMRTRLRPKERRGRGTLKTRATTTMKRTNECSGPSPPLPALDL